MLDNLGGWEMIALILIGLFIFGPERLPKAISDGLRMLRQLREMARNASADLSREMGTTVQLEDLNPKTFLRKHLLSEEDERALRRPLESVYRDLREASETVKDSTATLDDSLSFGNSPSATTPGPRPSQFDVDAT